jgi:hypothetical protein
VSPAIALSPRCSPWSLDQFDTHDLGLAATPDDGDHSAHFNHDGLSGVGLQVAQHCPNFSAMAFALRRKTVAPVKKSSPIF